MKAIRIHEFGDASALAIDDIEIPAIGAKDLLVRVKASGINPIEWKIRGGEMGRALGRELPATMGWACSGVVDKIGKDVTNFQIGDEVYAYPEFTREGTHAEYVAVAEAQVAKMPASLSFTQAAAVPVTAQAAWAALEAANVAPEERVLIHGAGGAVGHWLVQLAKLKGAYVIATASGNDLTKVNELGADEAVDYKAGPFEQSAGQVDVVMDLIGGETQDRSWAVLGPGGRLVSTAMPPNEALAKAASATGVFVFTHPVGSVLAEIGRLIDSGNLKTLAVAKEFDLTDASQAHRLGETGKSGGKMVLMLE
jgi:NADPH:quinone reductase-like Zn-dependent oxidoreductase